MKPSRHSRLFLLATLLVVIALPASAQIVFTVSGTAQTTKMGYTSGNAYTFTFTLNNYAPTSPVGNTTGGYEWEQSNGSAPILWSSVTGEGLTGSWIPSPADPDNSIEVIAKDITASDESYLELLGSTTSGTASGLMVNDVHLDRIYAAIFLPVDYFDTSGGSLPNPSAYLSAYLGSPSVFSDHQPSRITVSDIGENDITFTVTSLTISAVPEPSTYALFAGLAVLTGVVWHRRRLKTLVHHKS